MSSSVRAMLVKPNPGYCARDIRTKFDPQLHRAVRASIWNVRNCVAEDGSLSRYPRDGNCKSLGGSFRRRTRVGDLDGEIKSTNCGRSSSYSTCHRVERQSGRKRTKRNGPGVR